MRQRMRGCGSSSRCRPFVAHARQSRLFHCPRASSLACKAAKKNGHSEMVEQGLMYFIFQKDLGVQLQRALNMERYEIATKIRERRQRVEEAIAKHNEAKGLAAGTRSVDVGTASMDSLATTLNLQNELNEAVANEDYTTASQLRDRLAAIKETLQTWHRKSCRGMQKDNEEAEAAQQDYAFVEPQFRIGQRVEHKENGMTGVIVGWDRACCESEKWQQENWISDLSKGKDQPFYHLVIDTRDWWESLGRPNLDSSALLSEVPVAYAAEEVLTCPSQEGLTWNQKYPDGPKKDFMHPFEYILFLGKDNHGDFIPTAELRTAYNEQRRDVYPVDAKNQGGSDSDPQPDD